MCVCVCVLNWYSCSKYTNTHRYQHTNTQKHPTQHPPNNYLSRKVKQRIVNLLGTCDHQHHTTNCHAMCKPSKHPRMLMHWNVMHHLFKEDTVMGWEGGGCGWEAAECNGIKEHGLYSGMCNCLGGGCGLCSMQHGACKIKPIHVVGHSSCMGIHPVLTQCGKKRTTIHNLSKHVRAVVHTQCPTPGNATLHQSCCQCMGKVTRATPEVDEQWSSCASGWGA